ncbi:hypothetical protein SBA3_520018 [Candidatus Sulfopaludibacter sp. SbA3]|nr:hypothetical protein SBA3_520018 [Candidatus Sulfopaludibacter sp. SbA3]
MDSLPFSNVDITQRDVQISQSIITQQNDVKGLL